jgi:cysteinyl-tRNA synthetase
MRIEASSRHKIENNKVMTIQLYDTYSRQKREFHPADKTRVTMYLCGPTVYSYAHIGNARPAVVYDVLYRLLRAEYGKDHVAYARNITDVDDKINAAAKAEGVTIDVITDKFARIYREDTAALNVLKPDFEPTATGHMKEMIALVKRLIEAGNAYEAQGHVLFDVTSFDSYGALSRRKLKDMLAGARVEVATYKRNPADFVLWKPADENDPGWKSPWGRGRPGWHLECSAMIEAVLGTRIDIHAGGQDLIFPHHENERAQSMCSHDGKRLANYWLHNGFLDMDSEKMSKSLGNVKLIHELLNDWHGEVLRFALLSAHYRAPLDWTASLLEQAKTTLDRYYGTLRRLGDVKAAKVPAPARFMAALKDDLNTPQALAKLSTLSTDANKAEKADEKAQLKGEMLSVGALLGLFEVEPEVWFKSDKGLGIKDLDAAAIDKLVAARVQARQDKDWGEADRIRDVLSQMNIVIEDKDGHSIWRRQ